jgi:hypothetical protein
MQAAMNNQYAAALASGDPREAAKKYDRAGISRGAAQWNQAGIDSARSMSGGIAEAYKSDLANQQYNANLNLQNQANQEGYAQALGGLQQQNNYANQMAALQRQQTGLNFVSSLLGGLLN